MSLNIQKKIIYVRNVTSRIINTKDVKFKKIILFGCHAFKDAPHSTGNIFLSYFDHLDKTIEFIKHKKIFYGYLNLILLEIF